MKMHGTTILCVRKGKQVVMMGDGQVSQGYTVVKPNAKKVGGGVIGVVGLLVVAVVIVGVLGLGLVVPAVVLVLNIMQHGSFFRFPLSH